MDHLKEVYNFVPDDMTKGTFAALLQQPNLHPVVRELLEIRKQASATSPAKYQVIINATSSDGRLRGSLQFCGAARTGRWGGRLFQPQNLPRPSLKQNEIEAGIRAMKLDCEDSIFDNVSELCSSAVRACLIPSPGNKLVVADLSNIEGRVLAWLAGEDWKLQAFKDFDAGRGHDLYVVAYSRAFGIDPEAVVQNKKTGDGMMRHYGKTMELSCGFGGSVGAYRKMGGSAVDEMDDDAILALVKAWRKAHPRVVAFWYDVENAAKSAIRNPDSVYEVRGLFFDAKDGWLRIKLKSGRYLSYPNACIDDGGQIRYDGTNQYTRKWEQLETYYGKLVENIVQATARDVFGACLKAADKAGYEICLHVHDEIICDVPDTDVYSASHLSVLMSSDLSWSVGLPLAAAGFETHVYRKD
jgi:DNA polymerase